MPSVVAPRLVAALGDELTESEASVRVFLTAGGLAVLGLALLLFTIWWWRGTKPESPALGPLEVMSDRRWHSASDSERRRLVDTHRPPGALEVRPAPVPIDLSVLAREMPSTFDDLRDDAPSGDRVAIESEPPATATAVDPAAGGNEAAPALFELEPIADPRPEPQVEVAPGDVGPVDETMFAAERPEVASPNGVGEQYEQLTIDGGAERSNGEPDLEAPAEADDGRDDALVIDPLLQRAASQD